MSEVNDAPFNQTSWDKWLAHGRASDVAFSYRVRSLALAVGTICVFALAFWTLT